MAGRPRRLEAGGGRLAGCVALALAACAHAPPASPTPDAGAAARVEALAAEVAALRELPLLRPVPVSVDAPAEFLAHYRRKGALEAQRAGAGDDAEPVWVAFGFVAPAGSAPDAGVAADQVRAVAGGVLDEQLAGYYDEFEHRMHLPEVARGGAPSGADAPARARLQDLLVAHELDHALQDQHFGFERLLGLPAGSEARLCTNAVYEGDAMLAGLVHLARHTGISLALLLARTDAQLQRGELSGSGGALAQAPPVLRERLLFPYAAGLHLCRALYREGGWARVSQLFDHPPRSEAQLLHPEKYAAGELPVPVAAPALPPGQEDVAAGSLGELGVRVLLLEALSPEVARGAAAGWAGDAYRVSRAKGTRRLVLQWSSAWESEAAARRFEAALVQVASRWTDGPDGGPGSTLSAQAVVQRRGVQVALVRGLPLAQAGALAPGLLGLAGPRPASEPPLGPLVLPAEEPEGEVLPDGAFGSAPWSLYVPTPAGFRAEVLPDGALQVRRGGPQAVGLFVAVEEPYSEALGRRLFAAAEGKLTAPTRLDEGRAPLNGAAGLRRRLEAGPAGQRHRVEERVVPACGGKAAWFFALRFEDPASADALHAWQEAFVPQGPQGACSP
jgi:hypothetical protein